MENRKSAQLYMMAHTIDLTSREQQRQERARTSERQFERRSQPRPVYRGPERRDEFTGGLPQWKLHALEEELAIKNTSTLGRLIQSNKFRAGDREVLVKLLQQRGHLVLGEFVLYSQGSKRAAVAASA